MSLILGIDVGTTGTKSALFDPAGELVDIAYRSYPTSYPRPGWAEQDPLDWWRALVDTTRRVATGRRAAEVKALGLSTQGGCLVMLDGRFTPLRPAVSWMDRRASEVSSAFQEEIDADALYRICGWPVVDSLPLPTLYWFRKKMPGLFGEARYVASTIDFLNRMLTGRFAIDHTNLALTGFLDLRSRGLSGRTMAVAGLGPENLPEIVPAGSAVGKLGRDAADELGLTRDVVVLSGAHDRYCESIGTGALRPGDCVLGAGTSWVLLATTDRLLFPAPGASGGFTGALFPGLHPLDGRFGLMTVVPFGGNSLRWFREVFRPDDSYESLGAGAADVDPGSGGLLFIPVSSSRSGRGSFLGLDGSHTVRHFTRAVFEGVVLANRLHLDLLRRAGTGVERLIMIGGGAASGVWPRMTADACQVAVDLPAMREAACAGAAVLAGAGTGVFSSIDEGSRVLSGEQTRLEPERVDEYENQYRHFLEYLDRV